MKELPLKAALIFSRIKRSLNQLAQKIQQPQPAAKNLLNLKPPYFLLLNRIYFITIVTFDYCSCDEVLYDRLLRFYNARQTKHPQTEKTPKDREIPVFRRLH